MPPLPSSTLTPAKLASISNHNSKSLPVEHHARKEGKMLLLSRSDKEQHSAKCIHLMEGNINLSTCNKIISVEIRCHKDQLERSEMVSRQTQNCIVVCKLCFCIQKGIHAILLMSYKTPVSENMINIRGCTCKSICTSGVGTH